MIRRLSCLSLALLALVLGGGIAIVTGSSDASPLAVVRSLVRTAEGQPGSLGNLSSFIGQDRVTILLLGIDQRPDEAARHIPSRSDTMIIATVDPATMRAALISIPRDLVVPIPGHGNDKINTAHFWGENDRAGGGPDLAMRTVQSVFGVHVDYYARVDFLAFQRLIDAMGGIVVDVDHPILDDEYPTENYGVQRLYIPAGPQWMDGARALEYARSRHSENDFARQARQRQVILTAERKALQPAMLLQLPRVAGIVQQSVGTDIPLTQFPALVNLARSIPAQNILNAGITYDMIVDVNKDGTELIPNRPAIQKLFDGIFASLSPTPAPTSAPTANPIRVEVLNGTTRDGFAATTATVLQARGLAIVRVAQDATSDHARTTIVDRSGSRHAGAAIASILGVQQSAVVVSPAQPGSADVTVTLGFDVSESIR